MHAWQSNCWLTHRDCYHSFFWPSIDLTLSSKACCARFGPHVSKAGYNNNMVLKPGCGVDLNLTCFYL
jgi:hypothetical protein